MIEDSNLHLLITEDLYILEDSTKVQETKEIQLSEVAEQTEEREVPKKEEPKLSRSEKGTTGNQVLIAIESINEDERGFLSKIMTAVGLSNHDYVISEGTTKEIPNYTRAILFTTNPKFPLYEIYNFRKTELMTCPSLGQLMKSQEDKKKLWSALKDWFKIS